MTVHRRACAAALAVLGLAAMALAQVAPSQTGQAIDANPMVGSGGYNAIVRQPMINSQMYVDGNVTGLGAFQGHVPYRAPTELSVIDPSGTLSTFERQSVGVAEAITTKTYQTAPYYNPLLTVLHAPAIAAGSATPLTIPEAQTLGQRLYNSVTTTYGDILSLRSGQAIGPNTMGTIVESGIQGIVPVQPQPVISRPNPDDAFGILRPKERLELIHELGISARQSGEINARLSAALSQEINAAPAMELPGAKANAADVEGVVRGGPQGTGEEAKAGGGRVGARLQAALPAANQDVYLDVLVRMYQQRTGKAMEQRPAKPGEKVEPAGVNEAPLIKKQEAETLGPLPAQPSATPEWQPGQSRENAVEVTGGEDKTIIIHALAGRSRDMFNLRMAGAQQLLKSGKYYDAAEAFADAQTFNPSNPLAPMGRCLALFAAGEPFSSSAYLTHAIELFPPIMETRLDMSKLLDVGAVKGRLDNIEDRIARKTMKVDGQLEFIITYMYLNLGLAERARDHALLLLKMSGDDKLYAAFAEFVLTGRKPGGTMAPGATTAPAGMTAPAATAAPQVTAPPAAGKP